MGGVITKTGYNNGRYSEYKSVNLNYQQSKKYYNEIKKESGIDTVFKLSVFNAQCTVKGLCLSSDTSSVCDKYYLYVRNVPDNVVEQIKVVFNYYNEVLADQSQKSKRYSFDDTQFIKCEFDKVKGPLKYSKNTKKYNLRLEFTSTCNVFSGIDYSGNVADLVDKELSVSEINFDIGFDNIYGESMLLRTAVRYAKLV